MSNDDEVYELTMPFVLARSQGGPYDDAAFVAGMTCGQIWAELQALSPFGATPPPRYADPEHLKQLDLIAMHFGYILKPGVIDEASGCQRIGFEPGISGS